MLKKTIILLYAIVIILMAMATFVGQGYGQDVADSDIYGTWWFSLLWALLCAFGIAYFLKRKVKRFSLIALHASFIVILAGALLTHLSSKQGTIHIRAGETTNTFTDTKDDSNKEEQLPFSITLKRFDVKFYSGTQAPSDFVSTFEINDGNSKKEGTVSMNKIYSTNNVRLYQSGYDPDMKGTYLSINSDPYGIPVTYVGYALLFISLVWMLVDPKGRFVALIKSTANKKSALLLLLMLSISSNNVFAQTTIPKDKAEQMGRLNILYNDRICPLQTFAIDFTKKLYGKASFDGKTAEQVLTGFLFYPNEWGIAKVIKVKNGEIKEKFGFNDYASVSDFFRDGNYILGNYLQEAYQGNNDKFHQEILKLDDKLMLIMTVEQMKSMKIFPFKHDWYSPADKYPANIEKDRAIYFQSAIPMLAMYAQQGDWNSFSEMTTKMLKYQYRYGGESIPSSTQLKAERMYNTVPFSTILFILCLTFGFLSLINNKWIRRTSLLALILSFLGLSFCLALRWIISGTIPMSNGYETMLIIAWTVMLTSLIAVRRFSILLTFGLVLSGFCLLVSHISQLDPQITPLMPVLSSPLLSIHVSIIMISYALLALTFLCALWGIVAGKRAEEMQRLSLIFLYPALTCLGIGIFIGAIWANVSWGEYWSWDPKEVWALITFMVYAIPLHGSSLPMFRKPKSYHWFILLAFLVVLMTYFGVNYFLSGMHSYA